jgi:hypothetical protein
MSTTDEGQTTQRSLPRFSSESEEGLVPPVSRPKSRRQFLTLAAVVAGGVGLSAVDVITTPWVRRSEAHSCASFGYTGCFEVWEQNCRNFYDSGTICEPDYAYFGPDNCGGGILAFFHKDNATTQYNAGGVQYKAHYDHEPISCDGRNAWIWRPGTDTMCSDGAKTRWHMSGGEWVHDYTAFSICRNPV